MEEIIATEGVDALFVGPADLAAHMGHVGDSSHADVLLIAQGAQEQVARIRARDSRS